MNYFLIAVLFRLCVKNVDLDAGNNVMASYIFLSIFDSVSVFGFIFPR